ncbi:MAG: GNAT family N-acetyltransferase [Clostridia bacterium]|nr:GNAT family N-acetyltransferase [Clostridia bacterium]
MEHIRKAKPEDISRIVEIEIFNYRLNFYPIYKSDEFYFGERQVEREAAQLRAEPNGLDNTFVYDDGVVKGFIRLRGSEIEKLFVEPVLQGCGIGAHLLAYAAERCGAGFLWALEKNERAVAFYGRHGFLPDGARKPEEDTDECLIRLVKAR